MISRRRFILSSALAAGGAGALAVHPAIQSIIGQPAQLPALQFPVAFGGWRALPPASVILPPADTLSDAAYQQMVVQGFSDDQGPAIILVVAIGARQTYALQLHRPEVCYPASGFKILSYKPDILTAAGRKLPVSWIEARRGERTDRVLYWTRIGDHFVRDMMDQRITVARQAFQGSPARGVLVRISAETDASQQADERINGFLSGWLAALAPPLMTLVAGEA